MSKAPEKAGLKNQPPKSKLPKRNFLLTFVTTLALPAAILTILSKPEYLGPQIAVVLALVSPIAFAIHDFWGDIKRKESNLLNLSLNLLIPMLIFIKLSGENQLGAKTAVIIAVSIPALYGIADFFRVGKFNIFSALGVVSILLTGGIALLELDPKYIAIKEAAIPGLIFLGVLISIKTPYPLIKSIVYKSGIIRLDKVQAALKSRNTESDFNRSLTIANLILALSFLLSSVLNYVLAKIIVKSPAGTEAFNQEIGRMMGLSYPVIAIPSTIVLFAALAYLFYAVTRHTGLQLEEILVDPDAEEDEADTKEEPDMDKLAKQNSEHNNPVQ